MVLSQIIRFALPSSSAISAPAFLKLREFISLHGQVKDQDFGYVISPTNVPRPKMKDEICWIIQWPNSSALRSSASFRNQLNELTGGEDAKSLLFEFKESQMAELTRGLESPVTEFAIVNLSSTAPLSNADLKHSMNKTYTDCYFADGFIGGHWEYSLNTNNTDDLLIDVVKEQVIKVDERRLACYYLGWESIEHHQVYSRSALFDEEIDKLKIWFGPGTGAWYVKLNKHN